MDGPGGGGVYGLRRPKENRYAFYFCRGKGIQSLTQTMNSVLDQIIQV